MDGLTRYTPQALAVLRIVTALLFIAHGTMTLFNFPASGMSPPIGSIFWFAGVIEVVGGVLILLGLFTRPVAFVLAGEMAVAYFIAHAPQGFFPVMNGGEAAVLFCFVFLYLVFSGPGAWSLDARRAAA